MLVDHSSHKLTTNILFIYLVSWNNGDCGGTLISSDLVLSAAHCNEITAKDVLVGAYKAQSTQGGAIFRSITSRRVHPKYDGSSGTYNYDFLVLKLNKPVTTIPPVLLNQNPSNPVHDEVLTTIGFGVTTQGASTEPSKLRKVNVTYVDPATCTRDYGETINPKLELCAGSAGKDSCQGDSGGPILDSNGVQVGIVSWGQGCAQPGFPGIYARISGGIDWINRQICDLSDNPPPSCQAGTSSQSTSLSPSPTFSGTTAIPVTSFSTVAPGATPAPTFGGSISGGSPSPTNTASLGIRTSTIPPSATMVPSFSGRSSTYAPTVTSPPTTSPVNYTSSTNLPTTTRAPAPSFSGNSYSPSRSNAPAPSGGFTFAPTASSAPASLFSQTNTLYPATTLLPTNTGVSSFATTSPTTSPTSSTSSPGGSFSVFALRVACETFLCPYNHENVQFCHVDNNGGKKAYCVTADVAFMFLVDNVGDYCGPCVPA